MKFYLIAFNEQDERIVKDYLLKIGELVSSISACDIIISVGGDGTFLRAGKEAIKYDKPIVGVNAGHLGYLCAFKIEEIEHLSVEDFANLKETKRTLIEYNGEIAINDVCILKENPIHSIEVELENIASWKGDGVIVSTATGSSSYNQSAGGPLLEANCPDLIVNPICPHFAKVGYQIIKDDEVVINVSVRTPALISVDNNIVGPAKGKIIIKKSKKQLRLLTR